MRNLILLLLLGLNTVIHAQKTLIEKCDCPFDTSKIEAQEIWCGRLTVPENHLQPTDRKIQIMFTVIKPHNTTNDPVVLLPGGPGLGPVKTPMTRIVKNWLPANRTFVVFDPRGTGLSQPEMCPELNETYGSIAALDLTFEEAEKMRLGAEISCKNRLERMGIDLSQYSNDAIARDVHILMKELGYENYNLIGGSAGVPMIRSIMRLFPDNIRSAIFNNGPGIDLTQMFTYDVPNAERAFQNIVNLCSKDVKCNNKFPNLDKTFLKLYNDLKNEPLTIKVDRNKFKDSSFTINSQDFIVMMERWLLRENVARHLPAIIGAFEERNETVIRPLVENQFGGLDSTYSQGLAYSVFCNGSYTPNSRSDWEKEGGKSEKPFGELNFWLLPCEQWIQNYNHEETRAPFYSDIPSLILTGEYDPTTTERETTTHIPYFSNFQYYVIPGMAHGPPSSRESDCWTKLIKQFITNPNQKMKADCLEEIPDPGVEMVLPDM